MFSRSVGEQVLDRDERAALPCLVEECSDNNVAMYCCHRAAMRLLTRRAEGEPYNIMKVVSKIRLFFSIGVKSEIIAKTEPCSVTSLPSTGSLASTLSSCSPAFDAQQPPAPEAPHLSTVLGAGPPATLTLPDYLD